MRRGQQSMSDIKFENDLAYPRADIEGGLHLAPDTRELLEMACLLGPRDRAALSQIIRRAGGVDGNEGSERQRGPRDGRRDESANSEPVLFHAGDVIRAGPEIERQLKRNGGGGIASEGGIASPDIRDPRRAPVARSDRVNPEGRILCRLEMQAPPP